MDFDRDWHTFSLDAEVDAYGTSRIAGAHNRLREENARLRQRLEELERERDAAWAVRDAGWVQTEDALTRMRTAEARLARCVEALGEIRGRSLAAKTHEVGPLEAKGRLTRILELACAALAAAKGE